MAIKPIYTVIVPAYNEATIIEKSLVNLADTLKADPIKFKATEVVVVVADSPDGTADIVKSLSELFTYFTIVEPGKKVGKGRDVRAGVLASRGDYVLFTDADMATPPTHIYNAFSYLEKNYDVAIGVRPLSRIHNSFLRRARSIVSNLLIRTLAVPGVSDTQCGFKGFKREVAIKLFEPLETLRWGFDIEILVRARALGYKVKKININDWYDPKIGEMGLAGESDIHANLNTLKELFQVAYKRLSGHYKKTS